MQLWKMERNAVKSSLQSISVRLNIMFVKPSYSIFTKEKKEGEKLLLTKKKVLT